MPEESGMGVIAHFVTDRGLVKQNNEDAGGVFFGGRLVIVADGMGGGKAGEYASQQAVDQVREVVGQAKYYVDGVGLQVDGSGREVGLRGLEMAVQHANTFLYSMARANPSLQGMGTTLVACLIENGRALFANVGDSRGYILRGGVLRQITRDHSLFSDPKATKSNIITRALGRRSYAEVDCFEETLVPGDVVLLCSDGLSKVVPEEQILRELGHPGADLPEALSALLAKANANGGPDNISVAAVKVDALLGERCQGVWQPVALRGDGEDDADRSERTLVFKPGESPLSQPARLPAKAPRTARAEPPARRAWRAGTRPLLLAVAGCAAVVVIAVLLALPSGKPATQVLVVEVMASTGDAGRSVPIVLEVRGTRRWEAKVEVGGSGGWRLAVRYPTALAETLEPNGEGLVQVPVPAEDLSLASVRMGNGIVATASPSQNTLPMSSAWQAGQGGYRLSLITTAALAAKSEVWKQALQGAWPEAAAALEQLLKGAPPIAADAERRRFDEMRSSWELARRAGAAVRQAAEANDSEGLLALPARAEEFRRAVNQLDHLRPPGATSLSNDLDSLGLAPRWRVVERRLSSAMRLQAALDAARSAEQGGGLRDDLAARLRAALQEAGVKPTGAVAATLQRSVQSGASGGTRGATPGPTATPIAAAVSVITPTPTPLSAEAVDRWREVRELADALERARRQWPREELLQRRNELSLRREVSALRESTVRILAAAVRGYQANLPPNEVRAAIGEFVKLESHLASYLGCALKPQEDALALLRDIAAIPGSHAKRAQDTLAMYRGDCQ